MDAVVDGFERVFRVDDKLDKRKIGNIHEELAVPALYI